MAILIRQYPMWSTTCLVFVKGASLILVLEIGKSNMIFRLGIYEVRLAVFFTLKPAMYTDDGKTLVFINK